MRVRIEGILWKPGVNGLGVAGLHRLPYRRLFDAAARRHDACYDLPGGWRERREHDIAFLGGMVAACRTTPQACVAVAYFCAVRLFGWLFYRYDMGTGA